MEKTVERVLSAMIATSKATIVSLSLAYIAREDVGVTSEEIRIPALAAASVIAALLTAEFFGKKLRKPRSH
jgi:hypothetical protein